VRHTCASRRNTVARAAFQADDRAAAWLRLLVGQRLAVGIESVLQVLLEAADGSCCGLAYVPRACPITAGGRRSPGGWSGWIHNVTCIHHVPETGGCSVAAAARCCSVRVSDRWAGLDREAVELRERFAGCVVWSTLTISSYPLPIPPRTALHLLGISPAASRWYARRLCARALQRHTYHSQEVGDG
jgi:hypothetical protein